MNINKQKIPLDWSKIQSGVAEIEQWPDSLDVNSPVPDFPYNVLNSHGKLYTPEYDSLRLKENVISKPEWPDNSPFAVCLSHDLDHISKGSLFQTARLFSRIVNCNHMRGKQFKIAVKSLIDTLQLVNKEDPFNSLHNWMDLEKHYNVRSTFFVMSEVVRIKHFSDGCYKYRDKILYYDKMVQLADILREINDNGWEIGLHPSWHTYNNLDEMILQKRVLENCLRSKVISVRQHFLHYDYRITPYIQAQAGFLYDSTLGYNNNIGFRNGTSYPFHLNPTNTNKQGSRPVLQLPLIIQDVSLMGKRKGLGLPAYNAINLIEIIAKRVEKTGGVLTLSWHPNVWEDDEWMEVYAKAIELLKSMGAWFGTVCRCVARRLSES